MYYATDDQSECHGQNRVNRAVVVTNGHEAKSCAARAKYRTQHIKKVIHTGNLVEHKFEGHQEEPDKNAGQGGNEGKGMIGSAASPGSQQIAGGNPVGEGQN